ALRRARGRSFGARPDCGLVRHRRVGLRTHGLAPGRARPQRHGLGRVRRIPAHARDRAGEPRLAGGRLRALPLLRHPEAAAHPLARAPLPRRLRRDGGRLGRGGLRAPVPRRFSAAPRLMDALARKVGEALKAAGARLVTAESCTGGWVAQVVTSVAGSSDWFERGLVTYSNDAKMELLGVRPATLQRHGAVSEETAREMAQGALARSKGTIALAITGIAGPTGGSAAKPVGTVCFGWARAGAGPVSETRR